MTSRIEGGVLFKFFNQHKFFCDELFFNNVLVCSENTNLKILNNMTNQLFCQEFYFNITESNNLLLSLPQAPNFVWLNSNDSYLW